MCHLEDDLTNLCAQSEMQTTGGLIARAVSKCIKSGFLIVR